MGTLIKRVGIRDEPACFCNHARSTCCVEASRCGIGPNSASEGRGFVGACEDASRREVVMAIVLSCGCWWSC
jgi:hypothetical protein